MWVNKFVLTYILLSFLFISFIFFLFLSIVLFMPVLAIIFWLLLFLLLLHDIFPMRSSEWMLCVHGFWALSSYFILFSEYDFCVIVAVIIAAAAFFYSITFIILHSSHVTFSISMEHVYRFAICSIHTSQLQTKTHTDSLTASFVFFFHIVIKPRFAVNLLTQTGIWETKMNLSKWNQKMWKTTTKGVWTYATNK